MHKKYGGTSDVLQSYKKIEGQSQRVNYFFKKANTKTLSSLAVKYLWNYHKNYPEDEYINQLLVAALRLQTQVMRIHYTDIYPPVHRKVVVVGSDSTIEVVVDSFKVLSKIEYEDLSKYDKIRYDKKYELHFGAVATTTKSKTVKLKDYLKILSTESIDSSFKALYLSIDRTKEEEDLSNPVQINRILLVNPLFYRIKDDNLIVQGNEEKEIRFSKSLELMAKKRNIKTATLDILDIKYDEVDRFNDLAIMNAWLQEYENLMDIERMDLMIPWQTNYITPLREKYDLRYIATSGLLELETNKSVHTRAVSIIGAAVMWQAAPYFIYNAVSNYHNLYHFFYCVDLETNELIMDESQELAAKASTDFVNSINYNVMYQLKRKK